MENYNNSTNSNIINNYTNNNTTNSIHNNYSNNNYNIENNNQNNNNNNNNNDNNNINNNNNDNNKNTIFDEENVNSNNIGNIDTINKNKLKKTNDEYDEKINNIEYILRNYEKNNSLMLLNIECDAGSHQGDNYMSIVKRIRVKGKINENEDYNCSLILKRQLGSLSRRQLYRCDEAFENEIAAYTYVVPAFRKFTNNNVPFLANCLYAGSDENGEFITLEDLKESGYIMSDRLKGLDYEHCKIVMQELACMHAISLAMKLLDANTFLDVKNSIKDIVYCKEASEFYSTCLESALRGSLSSLQSTNMNGDLDESIEILQHQCSNGKLLYDTLYKIVHGNYLYTENDQKDIIDVQTDFEDSIIDNFKVICHGDLWINNLLFKYDSNSKVESVKFLDLQGVRYASPLTDILQFIYSSTENSVREQYLDKLLEDYQQSLLKSLYQHLSETHLQTYSMIAEKLTIEFIHNEFSKKSLYGLGTCMWLLPAVTFYPDNIPNLDSIEISEFTADKTSENLTAMLTPEYHCRLKDTVLEFFNKGFLNFNSSL